MDINFEINKLLNDISNHTQYTELFEDDFYNDQTDNEISHENYKNYTTTIQVAKNENLITGSFTFNRNIDLTPFGKKIIEKGGWSKHLEAEAKKTNREIERDKYDFETKKWIYKTRFLPYIISGFALIVSVLSYTKKDKEAIKTIELKKEIENIKKSVELEKLKINSTKKKEKPNG